MEKYTLIIIFLLFFLFSTKSWEVAWDIGKALLYIMIGIFLLSILDKDLSRQVKLIIIDLINIDNMNEKYKYDSVIMNYVSKISKFIMNYIYPQNKKIKSKETNDYTISNDLSNNFINDNQYQSVVPPKYKDNL